LAAVREDVRQTQERLIGVPILTRLRSTFPQATSLEEHLQRLLRGLASWGMDKQGYGPANLVALLCHCQGNLCGLDLSDLALRRVFLQGIQMQVATFTKTILQDRVFTETFDRIQAVAMSSNGQYWGASIGRGEVRV